MDECRGFGTECSCNIVRKTAYVAEWENNRQSKIKDLTDEGVIPGNTDEFAGFVSNLLFDIPFVTVSRLGH